MRSITYRVRGEGRLLLIEVKCKSPEDLDRLLEGQFPIDPIYSKVNKRAVDKLSFVSTFKGGQVTVTWVIGDLRYVRLYDKPRMMSVFNKSRTKIRLTVEGKYEREILK